MKPEEQQIAIAFACHFIKIGKAKGNWYGQLEGDPMKLVVPIPDYINDLNAMQSAENNLSPTNRGYYNAELFKLATGRNLSSAIKEPEFIYLALHATAPQRAEAFLRTIGKWVEE